MHDFQQSLIFSMVLSISFGPIALIILRQSILYGRMSAVPSALGAAIADVLYASVALMGAALVSVFVFEYRNLLVVASIIYLFYLGVKILKYADHDISVSQNAGFISVFALTMTNPLTIVAITSYVFASHSGGLAVNIPAFLSGFFIGSFACQMVYALGGDAVNRILSGRISFRVLNWLSGFYLIVFSIWKLHYLIKGGGFMLDVGWSMGVCWFLIITFLLGGSDVYRLSTVMSNDVFLITLCSTFLVVLWFFLLLVANIKMK